MSKRNVPPVRSRSDHKGGAGNPIRTIAGILTLVKLGLDVYERYKRARGTPPRDPKS